ncbi:hypothetical protein MXB_3278, partial [Myxobolus squamalis]
MTENQNEKVIFFEKEKQHELSKQINSLQLCYHDMILEEYNRNHTEILEKCQLLKKNSEFYSKCVELENMDFEQQILKTLVKNGPYSKNVEFQPKDDIIWSERDFEIVDEYFLTKSNL